MSEENIKTAIEAGVAIGAPKTIGAGSFAVLPEDYETHDLEDYQEAPRRTRAEVSMADVESFIAYWNRFKYSESTIFADREHNNIVGVVDYHGKKPTFCSHRAVYAPPYSEEWKRWKEASGRRMKQVEFAYFIEENASDVFDPTAAQMIEISQSIKASKKGEFLEDRRLSDGSVQLTYNEEVETHTGRNNLKVPESFMLGLPVFFNGVKYEVEAKLRVRIDKGQLMLWFDLHRAEYVEQDAFAGIVRQITDGCGSDVFLGRP